MDIRKANLCFDGNSLVAEVGLGDRRLNFELDTGNAETFLFPNFAGEFAVSERSSNQKVKYEMQGMGESIFLDSTHVSDLKLQVGSLKATLASVPLLLEPPPDICAGCYGNAGFDLLNRANTVTLDFKAMTLTLDVIR